MAISATVQWNVRTTGSDTNGGAFDPNVVSPGTDYSQQDSPQVAYTDLVIGATNTQLTSSAHAFTSAHVGNLINVTGGTGFTAGRYEIKSVSGSTATMDRAVGTASSTGGTGNLGGGMATPGAALAAIVSQNNIWVKSGTYTIAAQMAPPASASFSLIGYNSTYGDNGTAPTLTTSTNSTVMLSLTNNLTAAWVHNIAFSSTAGTPADCIKNAASLANLVVSSCSFTGFTTAIAGQGGIDGTSFVTVSVIDSLISGCVSGLVWGGAAVVVNSVFSGCSGIQIATSTGNAALTVSRSLIVGGASNGIKSTSTTHVRVVASTIAYNGSDGIFVTSSWPGIIQVEDCILYGNTGYGFNLNTANNGPISLAKNAWGGNSTAAYHNVSAGAGDVTLTSVPFTNHSGGDYSLNSTAGGGAACKAVGYPGAFPGGLSTGALDIGAVQSAAAAPVVQSSYIVVN